MSEIDKLLFLNVDVPSYEMKLRPCRNDRLKQKIGKQIRRPSIQEIQRPRHDPFFNSLKRIQDLAYPALEE